MSHGRVGYLTRSVYARRKLTYLTHVHSYVERWARRGRTRRRKGLFHPFVRYLIHLDLEPATYGRPRRFPGQGEGVNAPRCGDRGDREAREVVGEELG